MNQVDKKTLWESLNKDTQDFIRSMTESGFTFQWIKHGDVYWKIDK